MESSEDRNHSVDKRNISRNRSDFQPLLSHLPPIISTMGDASTDQHGAIPTDSLHHDEPHLLANYKAADTSFNGDGDSSSTLSDESGACDSISNGTLGDELKINQFPDVYLSTTSLLPNDTSSEDDDSSKTFGDESLSSNDTYLNSEKSVGAPAPSVPVSFNLDGNFQQSADEQFYADANDSFVSMDVCETISPEQGFPTSLDSVCPVIPPESLSKTAQCSESHLQATFTPESSMNQHLESSSCAVNLELEPNSHVSTSVEDNRAVDVVVVEAKPVETTVLVKSGGASDEDTLMPVSSDEIPIRNNGLDHCGSALGSPQSAFRKWSPPVESLKLTDGDSQSKGIDVTPGPDTVPENQQPGPFDTYDEELENLGNSRNATPTASSPFTAPIDFSRYSPAHVVAATGGASVAILRRLQSPSIGGEINRSSFTFVGAPSPRQPSTIAQGSDTVPETEVPPLLNITLSAAPELQPAKKEDVEACSELILGSFILETYRHEHETHAPIRALSSHQRTTAPSPPAPDKSEFHENLFGPEFASIPRAAPDSLEAEVAHRLAQWGDEIDRAYGSRLDRMIGCLPLNECPVQTFCEVARVLFSWGPTNWGQVIALFCFGYRLIIRRVRSGLLDAFRQVCRCLVSFCRQVNVFAWIAAQGGWQIVQYLTLGNRTEPRVSVPTVNSGDTTSASALWFSSLPQLSPWHWVVGLTVLCTALIIYHKVAR